MATRILLFVSFPLLLSWLSNVANAQHRIGDHIVIELTGNAAMRYSNFQNGTSSESNRKYMNVQFVAEIQKISDSSLHLVHNVEIMMNENLYRLILEGSVPPNRISTRTSPAGTLISASPVVAGVPSQSEIKTEYVQLEELKGFKLQRWRLEKEIAD